MKIKKFGELNESNDVEYKKFHIQQLVNAGYIINIEIINNRIVITDKSGYNLMNTNNNQLGVSNVNMFVSGLYHGITLEK